MDRHAPPSRAEPVRAAHARGVAVAARAATSLPAEASGAVLPLPLAGDPLEAPLDSGLLRNVQRTAGNAAAVRLVARAGEPGPALQRQVAPPGAAHPTLRQGNHGPDVQTMQDKLGQALAAHGPVTTDGQFGPTTKRRVREFQRQVGLDPDGVVGPGTWAALDGAVAAIPAPVRPALTVGATGPDVGLAQEKLNASAQAGPVLAITAVFDATMQTAVRTFQTARALTPPNGNVDAPTWTALDTVAPGGGTRQEGGTPVEQNLNAATPAVSTATQLPGTSLHAAVGPGGITHGPAVKEFQQKLNVWLTSQGQPVIRDDGGWGPRTQAATTAFQGSVPVPATGVGDLPTWNALDAIAPNVNVGFEERQWTEEVGGHTFGMVNAVGNNGSRYSWEIKPNEMKVTAAVNFVGGGPPGAWFGFVRNVWNHFILVDHATNQRLPINFEMTRDTGAGANTVQVSPGTGRANGGQWFLGDTAAASTIPHEYGHLIGLADEYQQHPGDYRTVTGHEPFVGQTTGPAGQTPQAIATALQAAMVARSSANAVAAVAGMAQGAFSQQVVQAYAALPAAVVPAVVVAPVQPAIPLTGNLVRDLDVALPPDPVGGPIDKYNTIEVLTYDSGSIMGDPGRHPDPHDHGAAPRHLQEFANILGRTRGGTWVPELR